MKKILTIILAITLAFIFSACVDIELDDFPDGVDSYTEKETEYFSPDEAQSETQTETQELESEKVPFGEFTSVTLAGEDISSDVFSEYDITMVNVWATFCPPCIGEMPHLQTLYSGLLDNVNMITVCTDASTQLDVANAILSDSGATFDTVLVDEDMYNNIISSVYAVPTTFFVDSEGNIVGEKIEGAPAGTGEQVVEFYEEEIKTRLESLNIK